MKIVSFILALAGATTALSLFKQTEVQLPLSSYKANLKFCADQSNYVGHIDYLDISPNPPVPGQNLTIKAAGKLSETVDEGSFAHVTVKWEWIQLVNKNYDLCDNAHIVDESCPLQKGSLEIAKDIALPKQIPPGSYAISATVYTKPAEDGGKVVTCMNGKIVFPR